MTTRKVADIPVTEMTVGPKWNGHQGNWDSNRVYPINLIVIHTMDGTITSANARFNDPTSEVSAHYGVGLGGQLIHWVDEDNVAYANGDYAVNQSAISIEHEDNGDYNGPRTDALYATSAKLVANICQFYDISCTRDYIKKHSEVSDKPTACPDALDIDRIVSEAYKILHPTPTSIPTNVGNPPIGPDVPLVLSDQAKLNFGSALGILEFGAVRSMLLDGQRDLTSAKETIDDQQVEITKLQEQIEAGQLVNKTQVSDIQKAVNSAPSTGTTSTFTHITVGPKIGPIPSPTAGLNIASFFSNIWHWFIRQ